MIVEIINCPWLSTYEKCIPTAILTSTSLDELKDLRRTGKIHLEKFRRSDIDAVRIDTIPNLRQFPLNFPQYFEYVNRIHISNCGIEKISRADLAELENLKEIHLKHLEIREIPSNLFFGLRKVEVVNLSNNEINFIGKNAFKDLPKLSYVDLRGNPSIDDLFVDTKCAKNFSVHASYNRIRSLKELQVFIDENFHSEVENFFQVQTLGNEDENLQDEAAAVVPSAPPFDGIFFPENVYRDMNKLIKFKDFKDFTIKIKEKEFKAHKLMLAARSPTLAEIFKENPKLDEIIFEDIEVEVFEILIIYIYDDILPDKYDDKSLKVFAAAGKLKLHYLKNHVGKILYDNLNPENSFEILKFASKYNCGELRRKSFIEFKKLFPDKKIKDDLINHLDKLKKLLDAKKVLNGKLN